MPPIDDTFFQRLDDATDYDQLVRGLYGDVRKTGHEVWLKCPYDDTPADKFSVNVVTGQWKNHKTGDGGAFIKLIKMTHAQSWKQEWIRCCPQAAAVLEKRRSDSGPKAKAASSPGEEPEPESKGKDKRTWAQKVAQNKKERDPKLLEPFATAYAVPVDFLVHMGTWVTQTPRLGKEPVIGMEIVNPADGSSVGIKVRSLTESIPTKSGGMVKSKAMFGSEGGVIGWDGVRRNIPLLIVEGEKDMWVVAHDFAGEYQVISPSNGASSWKEEWSVIVRDRDVVICYDEDEPGNKGARRAAALIYKHARTTRIAHVGVQGKDAFNILREDKERGRDYYAKILAEAQVYDPNANPGETDTHIKTLCMDPDLEPNKVADLLFGAMRDAGASFVHVDANEAFCVWRGQVYDVHAKSPHWKMLVYGYTGRDGASSDGYRIHDHIKTLALTRGDPVAATTWFARQDDALFLPLYGPEQKILRIAKDSVIVVPNGYGGVVLMPDTTAKELTYLPDNQYDAEKAAELWEELWSNINAPTVFRRLVECIVLSLPFYSWCETHPLIRFQGNTGSGKSFSTKIITTLLFGEPMNQGGDTMAALYRMAGMRMLLCLDNLEASNLHRNPEIKDLMLRSASGMTRAKSAKDDERKVVNQPVTCWVMSTGKSPIGVGHEDMEERLVVIPMGGNERPGFSGTNVIRWVQQHRTILFSYFVRKVREIYEAMCGGSMDRVLADLPRAQRPRLNEWYAVLAVASGDRDRAGDEVREWLGSAYEGEKESVFDSDPLITIMLRARTFLENDKYKGFGEGFTLSDTGTVWKIAGNGHAFFALFAAVARENGIYFPTRTSKELGFQFRSLKRRSKEFGIEIGSSDSLTRVENTGKRSRTWQITIHKDAIKSVPDDESSPSLDFPDGDKEPF